MPTPSLGASIRQRRKSLGLTQEQLAERISGDGEYLRQSDISRIEHDEITLPRRARLERLAAALDVSLGELLARSGWAQAESWFSGDMAGDDLDPALLSLQPSLPLTTHLRRLHELRTQLALVSGFTAVLVKEMAKPQPDLARLQRVAQALHTTQHELVAELQADLIAVEQAVWQQFRAEMPSATHADDRIDVLTRSHHHPA
jgi:transcriptional regulator with XRE-family HTH domain